MCVYIVCKKECYIYNISTDFNKPTVMRSLDHWGNANMDCTASDVKELLSIFDRYANKRFNKLKKNHIQVS